MEMVDATSRIMHYVHDTFTYVHWIRAGGTGEPKIKGRRIISIMNHKFYILKKYRNVYIPNIKGNIIISKG